MSSITRESTLLEVAAIVSDALQKAGIAATLSGGSAVSIYTENAYQSRDLDFVMATLYVDPKDCAVIDLSVGQLRIITPTQSVMDRLAAAYAWTDAQSRELAILVAANQVVDWNALKLWFTDEGESDAEFERFRNAVKAASQP
jgi:hypothetical protein